MKLFKEKGRMKFAKQKTIFYICKQLIIQFHRIMKQIILFLFLCLSLAGYSQQQKDSTVVQSIVVQKVDQVTIERVNNIENKLNSFHNEMRTSQFFTILGSALIVAGAFNSDSNESNVVLPLAGVCSSLIGTIIYLDSYKHLNMKYKSRKTNY